MNRFLIAIINLTYEGEIRNAIIEALEKSTDSTELYDMLIEDVRMPKEKISEILKLIGKYSSGISYEN